MTPTTIRFTAKPGMMAATETATVYRGGGRRWFTLAAACRAEARMTLKTKCDCDYIDHERYGRQDLPCSLHHPDRYPKIMRRLTRIYIAAAKAQARAAKGYIYVADEVDARQLALIGDSRG